MEEYEVEHGLEVLHEFLIVDPLVAVNVGQLGDGDDCTRRQINWLELPETMLELQRLQESLVVLVVVAEYLEQSQVLVLRHHHVIRLEYSELDQLGLSAQGLC